MNVYAYCLGDELTEGPVEACAGVGGGAVRVAGCGGLWAVVSEFEGERAGVTRENVAAHNAVLARVLARTTPLPFRFGTLTTEARLAQFVAEHGAKLSEALSRVRGCVEMSVKVLRAGDEGRGVAATGDAAGGSGASSGSLSPGSGTAYLAAKRRELSGDEASRARAEEAAGWLARSLGATVREARVRLCPSERLLLSASHLVERGRVAEYRERVRAARAEREGVLRFLTSGAWPPYSFCDLSPAKIPGPR